MKHKEFIAHLVKQHPEMYGIDAKKIVNLVFETIKQVLLDGESVNIPGMCTLYPKYQDYGDQGKVWRNPHNGEVTTIHSKVQLRCRPTRAFQNKMTERLIDG